MIDLHCHLLAGIDDGPTSMEESLAMARMAVANGIQHAVVTPHIHPGRYDNDRIVISNAVNAFRTALDNEGIPLEVSFAAEVRVSAEVLQLIEQEKIPFLGRQGDYRVLLLEFPHSHIPPGSDKFIHWLLERGIRPLIAHPERNKAVIRDLDVIRPFVQAGCLLQLTAGAVAGAFGPAARERACQLLLEGWVSVLASDAHNLNVRVPDLEPGRSAAAAIIGEEAAWCLVRDNPAALTAEGR